ncbi:MAG: glycogen synthase GlgA [Ruminiclostridium sp.]|nr:glycogen synthase GlgA [Ruminiclostridium sp.]
MKKSLKILFISAEVAPYAKTGGLADVAGSLPQKLKEMGHEVRVALPGYQLIGGEQSYIADFPVEIGGQQRTCIVRQLANADCITYTLNNYHFFNRRYIYCYDDDGARFAFLCKASLELIKAIDFKPDILHLNDWHVGPAAMLLKVLYQEKDPYYKGIKTLFTIHNLEYQGHFGKETMELLGLPHRFFTPEGAEFYGMFNFLKSGVVFSDKINTVSKTYAEEILTQEHGESLEGVLLNRVKDLSGIINGIGYDTFNPMTDPHIPHHFNEKTLSNKAKNKQKLQDELGLPRKDVPLVTVVHRLVSQKGLNLVFEAFDDMMALDTQFALLGLGDPYLEDAFLALMKKYPDRVSVKIEFNEELSHRMYAGGDIFLMPSVFEPCGLGQMISLRYGTIPIVRETGGLKDTIVDASVHEDGNGFSFSEITSAAFFKAFKRAVDMYRNEPGSWLELVKRGMRNDFSWEHSAKEYLSLYDELLLQTDE